MGERVLIIWTILAFVLSFLFRFIMKRKKRKTSKYMMYYKIALVLIGFLAGWLTFFFTIQSPHPSIVMNVNGVWIIRLVVLALGAGYAWFIYSRSWTVRDLDEYKKDSLFPEILFVLMGGMFLSIAIATAPQVFGVVPYSMNVSSEIWDLPLVFLVPTVVLKVMDMSGHMPFKEVENPWIFPIEKVNPQLWPWRDLMQVRFELKKSLIDEHNMYTWCAEPVIEAPREVDLGRVFRLCIQERRNRQEYQGIQDMGDEYDGTPKFCWIFYLKRRWWLPQTWFRKERYLNPSLSIEQNDVRGYDIIRAMRIPGDGSAISGLNYDDMMFGDQDKTIIIKRI